MLKNNLSVKLKQLEELRIEGYIFRGHKESSWEILPNFFRKDTLDKQQEEFPVKDSIINNDWKNDPDIWTYAKSCLFCEDSTLPVKVNNMINYFMDYLMIIMRWHYFILKFYQEEPNYISLLGDSEQNSLKKYSMEDFYSKDFFIRWFKHDFMFLIERFDTSGHKIQSAHPNNQLTDLKLDLPQHYGFPSHLLDWSCNPLIATWFAIYSFNTCEKTKTETGRCIYAYKELNTNSSPAIRIQEIESINSNPRAKNQEGVFTKFKNSLNFYLKESQESGEGRFPAINDYINSNPQEFTIETIELPEEMIPELEVHLRHNGIDCKHIKPDCRVNQPHY